MWGCPVRGTAEADDPLHFLLFSIFPVAQNLMGVGRGVVPSQQSPFGPSVPSLNHITEIRGLPKVCDFSFFWGYLTPNPAQSTL